MQIKSVFFLTVLSFILAACSSGNDLERQHLTGPTMGTQYHVTAFVKKDMDINSLHAGIIERLAEVNAVASTYQKDSELSLLNKQASEQTQYPMSVAISAELQTLLVASEQVYQESQGAFDISVGPLVNRWGFGPDDKAGVPSEQEISELKSSIGQDALVIEEGKLTLNAKRTLDLSAIAKGWGVDVVGEYLEQQGVNSYLIDIGGEVRAKGLKEDNEKWRVAIERPTAKVGDAKKVQLVLGLKNQSLATSGDYRNYFEDKGRRYSHTINPQTGYPVTHGLASVSVIYENCMLADAYATAISVLGPEKGLEFAKNNELAVYLIVRVGDKFEERYSPLFKAQFMAKKD